MSALDDIKIALDSINKAAEELGTPAVSVGDTLLDAVCNCLKENGYTVTPPEVETPIEETTDTPTEA